MIAARSPVGRLSAAAFVLMTGIAFLSLNAAGARGTLEGALTVQASLPEDTLETTPGITPSLDVPPWPPGPVYRIPVDGIIDLGLAAFVRRVVEEAASEGAAAILLDIDTFGGRVDAAVAIRDTLLESEVTTIAYVNPRAISAGALISLACNTIAMTPGGSIGAVTPVQGSGVGEMEAADEKMNSYMRAEMRATAERRGRRGDLAEAMVDRDVEIEGVIAEGKLLTLTTEEALTLGMADMEAKTIEEIFEQLKQEAREVADFQINWAERIARVISHPVLSSLLISLGFLGIMLELYHPGWGLPGTLGVICLLVFFLGHYVIQLAGFEEILLFGLGILLLGIEILVIPGFGVAGIAGIVAILVSIVLALVGLEWRISWELGLAQEALVVVSAGIVGFSVGALLLFRFLPKSRLAHPIVLRRGLRAEEDITSHKTHRISEFPVGTRGVSLGDLRPAGGRLAGADSIRASNRAGRARYERRKRRPGTDQRSVRTTRLERYR